MSKVLGKSKVICGFLAVWGQAGGGWATLTPTLFESQLDCPPSSLRCEGILSKVEGGNGLIKDN